MCPLSEGGRVTNEEGEKEGLKGDNLQLYQMGRTGQQAVRTGGGEGKDFCPDLRGGRPTLISQKKKSGCCKSCILSSPKTASKHHVKNETEELSHGKCVRQKSTVSPIPSP